MYMNFVNEWLPRHPEVGVVEEDREEQRKRLTEEALDRFGKRGEYKQMVEDHKERLMKDGKWREFVKALPLEGKELGEAVKALKAVLGWEDGAPVLCGESMEGERVPALEDEIVESVVLPWVLEHWREAVARNKK
ncbi:MAG: hypothetical protein Q9226_007220 [Calogaya cf. arnoldii]